MSIKIMSQIWDVRGHFTSTEKMVLLKIADCAADDGSHAFPSISTIANACSIAERTVYTILDRLYKRKILSKRFRMRLGKITSNLYSINLKLLTHYVNNPVNKSCITCAKKETTPDPRSVVPLILDQDPPDPRSH